MLIHAFAVARFFLFFIGFTSLQNKDHDDGLLPERLGEP
jgi:hypothetical protein